MKSLLKKLLIMCIKENCCKSYCRILTAFCAFVFLFFLTSCENFLSGCDLKNQIENAIEYENLPYVRLTVSSEGAATASIVPAAGFYDDKYKAGDSFSVKFEENSEYIFEKWVAVPAESVHFNDAGERETVVTILNAESNVEIKPYTYLRGRLTVNFVSENGSTVPAEQKTYYPGEKFSLSYKSVNDYSFTSWSVIDDDGNPVDDALEFIGSGTDVEVKVLKDNCRVNIVANSMIRPYIVSVTPSYDSNGVYRDRRVVVMFDTEMDESSIYYNQTEQNALIAKGYTLLCDEKRGKKVYGYWDGSDKKTYVYKNIKITNRKLKAENFLSCYDSPYFDEYDRSVLRIDAKAGNEAPPPVTDILVTISRNMNSTENENGMAIQLSGDYNWAYYTNNHIDTDSPVFTTSGLDEFSCQFADDDQITYVSKNRSVLTSFAPLDTTLPEFSVQAYKDNNLRNKKLWVKGTFSDGGSGPAYLSWRLYKVNSGYYQVQQTELCGEGRVDIEVVGTNAMVGSYSRTGARLDIPEELSEGTYRIDFVAYDKNERFAVKSYYFVYDLTPPSSVDARSITNSRPSAIEETITWKDPDNSDFEKIIIEQYLNGEKTAEYEVKKGSKNCNFTGMTRGKYQYKFYSEDMYGNRTKAEDAIVWQDDVKPAVPKNVYIGSISKKRIRINYTVPDCEEYDYLVISGASSSIVENGIQGKEYYYEVKDINGKSYDKTWYLQSVDFAGNFSDRVAIKPKAGDVKPGMICYKSKIDNNLENFFFSFDYISDMTPLGVVCDSSDTSKVKIWDLNEVTGWIWGKDAKPCSNEMGSYGNSYYWDGRNHADGLTWYNLILKDYYYLSNDKINSHYTIWNWLRVYKNDNSPVTWYIPGIFEYECIINNYSVMQNSYTLLGNNGHTVKFFTQKQPYWTASARYYSAYANVVMLNQSNDGCAHELCKNGNNTLWITGDKKESEYCFKDEVNARWGSDNKALITHAMAQVNMN